MDEPSFGWMKLAAFGASLLLVIALELLFPWAQRRGDRGYGRLRNVPMAVFNGILLAVVCGACMWTASAWADAHGFGLLNRWPIATWAAFALTVVALDLVSWIWHRAAHSVPLLWRFHAVHHSDPVFDVSTSLRFHAGELLLSLPVRLSAAVVLGAPAEAVLLFEALFGFFNLFEHGNVRLPVRLERVACTLLVLPALHRVHHSVEPSEFNRNFGTIFSIWDRSFGTYLPATSDRAVAIGLRGVAAERVATPLSMFAMPFRNA